MAVLLTGRGELVMRNSSSANSAVGQLNFLAAAPRAMRDQVEFQVGDPDHVDGLRSLAAQDRPDAGQKLGEGEWFIR